MLSILSFVADVPFEVADKSRSPVDFHSTLTHVLPFVSKKFHALCSGHDLYWKNALIRLVKDDSYLWKEGLKRVIFESQCESLRDAIIARNQARARRGKRTKANQLQSAESESGLVTASEGQLNESHTGDISSPACPDTPSEEQLLHQGCQALQSHPPPHHTASTSGIYQCLYQSILLRHLRFQAPVFYMPTSVRLGSQYGLHFFEPRYRLLVAEVMASFPVPARRGEAIPPVVPGLSPFSSNVTTVGQNVDLHNLLDENKDLLQSYHLPTFIHAHQSPLRRNTPASIVQVRHCVVAPDGSADILLEPVAYIWVEELWERPGTGGLYEARGVRMGKDASDSYEMWCAMSGYGRGDGRGWGQMLPIP